MATIGHLSTWKTWRKITERFSENLQKKHQLDSSCDSAIFKGEWLHDNDIMWHSYCWIGKHGGKSTGRKPLTSSLKEFAN